MLLVWQTICCCSGIFLFGCFLSKKQHSQKPGVVMKCGFCGKNGSPPLATLYKRYRIIYAFSKYQIVSQARKFSLKNPSPAIERSTVAEFFLRVVFVALHELWAKQSTPFFYIGVFILMFYIEIFCFVRKHWLINCCVFCSI